MRPTTLAAVSVTFLNHYRSLLLWLVLGYYACLLSCLLLSFSRLALVCLFSLAMRQAEEIRLMGKRPPGSKRRARALLFHLAEKFRLGFRVQALFWFRGSLAVGSTSKYAVSALSPSLKLQDSIPLQVQAGLQGHVGQEGLGFRALGP